MNISGLLSESSISAVMTIQWRYLGIYEAPVYTVKVRITGHIDWDRVDEKRLLRHHHYLSGLIRYFSPVACLA